MGEDLFHAGVGRKDKRTGKLHEAISHFSKLCESA